MNYLVDELKKAITGKVLFDNDTLEKYSKDASIFKIKPEIVIYPKNADDIKQIVRIVARNKPSNPNLSITARAAGTCMSGGSINESIILDFTKNMGGIINFQKVDTDVDGIQMGAEITMLPGTYYREVHEYTLEHGFLMPAYTASKDLCAVGGMVGNNAGGEKSIKYGKVENFIKELKIVLRDGNEYTICALNKTDLEKKCAQNDVEGEIYRDIWQLYSENKKEILKAKPSVQKNSAGYYLWNLYNPETELFDLCKVIVGSQGTFGIVTEVTWYLIKNQQSKAIHISFLKNLDQLGEIVDTILPFKPESVESYDDYSLKLAIKFFPDFIRQMSFLGFIRLGLSFIPEAFMLLRGGLPKLVLISEFVSDNETEVNKTAKVLDVHLTKFKLQTRITDARGGEKYWRIRRESFNLLRKHVKGKHTAPFVDDICVSPNTLPKFLPELNSILDKYKLTYTIAGHAGSGNFHIIPLMDFKDPKTRDTILTVSNEVYDLVAKYAGTITAEHNDGLVRTPYLNKIYSPNILALFKKTKEIFDPLNIFNPNKKVGADTKYLYDHIDLEKPTQKHGS